MKKLVIYDYKGNIKTILSNANDKKYGIALEDIQDNKEIIGVDLETSKIITIDKNSSQSKKDELIDELMKKNEAYNNKVELEQLKKVNEELNVEVKNRLTSLEEVTIEMMDNVYN